MQKYSRKPYAFLVTTFALLFKPSTIPSVRNDGNVPIHIAIHHGRVQCLKKEACITKIEEMRHFNIGLMAVGGASIYVYVDVYLHVYVHVYV